MFEVILCTDIIIKRLAGLWLTSMRILQNWTWTMMSGNVRQFRLMDSLSLGTTKLDVERDFSKSRITSMHTDLIHELFGCTCD